MNNLLDYIVIWLDEHIKTSSDCQKMWEELKRIVPEGSLHSFTNVEECHGSISAQMSSTAKIFLILSSNCWHGYHLWSLEFSNCITQVYVYCGNKEHFVSSKLAPIEDNVFSNKTELLVRLQVDIVRHMSRWITLDATSTQNISGSIQCPSYKYQEFLQVICRESYTQNELQKAFEECRAVYSHDRNYLTKINNCQENYSPNRILELYTEDSFLYRIVNDTLRCQIPYAILKVRPFIVDLNQRLYTLMRQQTYSLVNKTFFHGQYMSITEFNHLRTREGKYIMINSFWSTSENKTIAENFIPDKPTFASNKIRVLCKIKIDDYDYLQPDLLSPFASIKESSTKPEELEVLFSPGTEFLIEYIDDHKEPCDLILKLQPYKNRLLTLLGDLKSKMDNFIPNFFTTTQYFINCGPDSIKDVFNLIALPVDICAQAAVSSKLAHKLSNRTYTMDPYRFTYNDSIYSGKFSEGISQLSLREMEKKKRLYCFENNFWTIPPAVHLKKLHYPIDFLVSRMDSTYIKNDQSLVFPNICMDESYTAWLPCIQAVVEEQPYTNSNWEKLWEAAGKRVPYLKKPPVHRAASDKNTSLEGELPTNAPERAVLYLFYFLGLMTFFRSEDINNLVQNSLIYSVGFQFYCIIYNLFW